MTPVAIIHYDEIALKGKNRKIFEDRLLQNIRRALRGMDYVSAHRYPGRLLIRLKPETDRVTLRHRLQRVFGVANFSIGIEIPDDLDSLKENALRLIQEFPDNYRTLKIDTRRSNKEYPLKSPEVNAEVGAYVLPHLDAKVDLSNPDLACHIELVNKRAFLYLNKTEGARGLPVGVSGRVAAMLSGGIDSPVAAWQVMRRGCEADFIHFYSYPYTDKASLEKVIGLTQHLTEYQYRSRLHLVPFADTQLQIVTKAPAELRVVLYRRMMIRIAEAIARRNRCEALVTGESLAQVASQTLRNLATIESVASIPILRPLIGTDKNQIVQRAERIGTFEISTLPYDDCCSLFVPDHPATSATQRVAEKGERELDIPVLVEQALEQTEVREFRSPSSDTPG